MVGSLDVECGDVNGGMVTCVFVVEIGRKSWCDGQFESRILSLLLCFLIFLLRGRNMEFMNNEDEAPLSPPSMGLLKGKMKEKNFYEVGVTLEFRILRFLYALQCLGIKL